MGYCRRWPLLLLLIASPISVLVRVDDRYFYDPVAHKYTVKKWLDDVNARYGGVDSILMWPTCTCPLLLPLC